MHFSIRFVSDCAAKLAAADPVEAQRRKYEEENKKKVCCRDCRCCLLAMLISLGLLSSRVGLLPFSLARSGCVLLPRWRSWFVVFVNTGSLCATGLSLTVCCWF